MDRNSLFLSKFDRKSAEKNRRDQMKALYCTLSSLLPDQSNSSKEVVSLSDKLGEAAEYIKKLQERLEAMKQKKNYLLKKVRKSADLMSSSGEMELPRIEVHANASTLKVVLITGAKHHYMFKEAVRILHEEAAADVVSAGFSVVDQTVFHTIYSQIGGSGVEYEAARISERLRSFVADDNN